MEPLVPTMRQLEERQVEMEVSSMLWSPKMDVLAMAMSTGDVALYRLNWQKVWSHPPPLEGLKCHSLCWRPDGRVLAAGFEGGRIELLDVEKAVVMHSFDDLDGAITAITWALCKEREGKESTVKERVAEERLGALEKEDPWRHMSAFPQLKKAYSINLQMVSDEEVEGCQRLYDSNAPISLLLVGTDKGRVNLYMNGFLLCASIDINVVGGGGGGVGCSVLHITVAPNLSSFSVVCKEKDVDEARVVVFLMPIVATCFEELERLSQMYSVLHGIMEYISGLIKHISEAWEGIVTELDAKLTSYAERLRLASSHDRDGHEESRGAAMATEFLELLMFGIPSVELEHFLIQELTDKGLKKLITSIDASYLNVQRLVLKYLSGVAQSLNYFLGQLSGMVMADEKVETALGLSLERVRLAQRKAAAFWAKGMELQQVVDQTRKSFRVFFRWLHAEIIKLGDEEVPSSLSKMSQQEIAFIAEFLLSFGQQPICTKQGQSSSIQSNDGDDEPMGEAASSSATFFSHRHLEKVGQYLRDASLEQPFDRSSNAWHAFLDANPDLRDSCVDILAEAAPETSLVQEKEELVKVVEAVFTSLFTQVTDKCRLVGAVRIPLPEGTSGEDMVGARLCADQLACPQSADGGGGGETVVKKGKVLGVVGVGSRAYEFKTEEGDQDQGGQKLLLYQVDAFSTTEKLSAVWLTFGKEEVKSDAQLRLIGAHLFNEETLSLFLGRRDSSSNQRLIQLPLSQVEPFFSPVISASACQPAYPPSAVMVDNTGLKSRDVFDLADQSCHRDLENMVACTFAVSGPRKVASFLFRNRKRVRIYDMEVEEDEDDDDDEEGMGQSGLSSSELNTSH